MIGLGQIVQRHLHEFAPLRVHRSFPQLFGVHLSQALVALQRVAASHAANGRGQGRVVVAIFDGGPLLHPIQRRHADKDVPRRNERAHIAEKERKQNCADMRAILVRVRKDDHLVVFQRGKVEILAHARTQSGDDGAEFFIEQHLIQSLFFRVERLTAQR